MRSALVRQFRNPAGPMGALAGWIMATRPSNRRRNEWTVELLQLRDGERVLEVGCGPGVGIAACLRAARLAQVVGADPSALMLRQAARRNQGAVAAGVLHLLNDALPNLSAVSGPFHKAFSANVLQFVPDVQGALLRLRGLLSPAGVLATTYQPRHAGATADDAHRFAEHLSHAMAQSGFGGVRVEQLALVPLAVCVLGTRKEE